MRLNRLLGSTCALAVTGLGLVTLNAGAAPTPAAGAGGVKIGMSAPSNQWDARLAETGPVQARRLFGQLNSADRLVKLAASEVAAGRYPILSFKLPGNDWAGVGAGRYDTQLRTLSSKLDAIPGQLFVTLHHEPEKDGSPANFAAMQRRALPILGAPGNVDAGVIANGFWWSSAAQGRTDAEIAQWLPADVRAKAEIVAADTYQAGTNANPGEGSAVKIRNLSAWATRVGVTRLGIGEYNGFTAGALTAAGNAVLADSRFVFAAVFNSNRNNGEGVTLQLTGARLAAFRETLAKARNATPPTTPAPTTPTTPRPTTSTGPSSTPTPTSTSTPTGSTPPVNGRIKFGMSTERSEFAARLAQTGPIESRRLFGQLSNVDGLVRLAQSEIAAGRYPILSFKIPNNDWAGVGAGTYDAQLRGLTAKLDALPGQVFVALHHEPNNDGTPANFAAMQRRALPILAAPSNVDAGVIMNGFIFSPRAQGLTDAEIAQWLPADVLRSAEIVGADTYHGGTTAKPLENAAPKIRAMSAWATRVGVKRLGIGEYNGLNAAAITEAADALFADKRFVFASIFNSDANNRDGVSWVLTGDRLAAFRETLARARADG